MYIPDHFAIDDQAVLLSLVRENNFGTLVSMVNNIPVASHIPFDLREQEDGLYLYGHVAKANPHWRHFAEADSLAIFEGPHSYISPTWYETPGVPTWNYCIVHMTGPVTTLQPEENQDIVEALSEYHEADNPDPWIPDYPQAMLSAIVSFKMQVTKLEGKFKLSQNRPMKDKQKVAESLRRPFGQSPRDHHDALLGMMEEHNQDIKKR